MTSPSRLRRVLAAALLALLLIAPFTGAPQATASAGAPAYDPDPAWGLDPGFGDRGLASVGPVSGSAQGAASVGDETWFAGTADTSGGGQGVLVAKLTPTGTLDPSVGDGDGQTTVAVPGLFEAGASGLVIDSQGRLLVVGQGMPRDGTFSDQTLFAARFTPDLELDPSFGDGGVSHLSEAGGSAFATDVQVRPDGSIVLVGDVGDVGDARHVVVVQVTSGGDLDREFGGGDGIATIPGLHATSFGLGLSITSDAKIVVAGANGYVGGSAAGAVFSLLPTGAPDIGFGTNGVVAVPGLSLSDVVRTPSGNLVVVGPAGDRGGQEALRLVQVSRTGHLVVWPGSSNPQRTLAMGNLHGVYPASLALQHSGKLVIAGSAARVANPDNPAGFLVVRALADGTPALGFGPGGKVYVTWQEDQSPHGPVARGSAVTVSRDDRIVVTGTADPGTGRQAGVVRFAQTTAPLAPVTELREIYSTGAWYSCGTTASNPCRIAAGKPLRFGGRIWPAPFPGPAQLSLQRTSGTPVTKVSAPTTPEGNFAASFDGPAPGSYRVHVVVPDSDTTVATKSVWRYVTVS